MSTILLNKAGLTQAKAGNTNQVQKKARPSRKHQLALIHTCD